MNIDIFQILKIKLTMIKRHVGKTDVDDIFEQMFEILNEEIANSNKFRMGLTKIQ